MLNISELISLISGKKALGVLIKKPSNVYYITNFSGEGYVYFTKGGLAILYTDGRYFERALKECFAGVKIVKVKTIFKDIARDVLKRNAKLNSSADNNIILFESDYIAYDEYAAIDKALTEELKAATGLIPAGDTISKIRSIKDESELKFIAEAVSIAEKSMIDALKKTVCVNGGSGRSEEYLALTYKKKLLERNSAESFDTIVLSGKNSSLPHGAPSIGRIDKKNVLLCDFGAERSGYKSDETFTIHLGKPDGIFLDAYDAVYSAQQKAISKIKPGVKFSDLDKIARNYITKRGYGKYFTHSLGHGVGLDIHEYPYVSRKNDDVVQQGMVFTIEPGIYIEGEFGIRIEDMCYVEKECARVITNIKKNKFKVKDLI